MRSHTGGKTRLHSPPESGLVDPLFHAPRLDLHLELEHFYFPPPDSNLITQDSSYCQGVKRVKNTFVNS